MNKKNERKKKMFIQTQFRFHTHVFYRRLCKQALREILREKNIKKNLESNSIALFSLVVQLINMKIGA